MELDVEGISYEPKGRILRHGQEVLASLCSYARPTQRPRTDACSPTHCWVLRYGVLYQVKGSDFGSLLELSKVSSLCNLSGLNKNEHGVWERIGESTEAALKVPPALPAQGPGSRVQGPGSRVQGPGSR
eukprot:3928018-Rhodomonas_salina.1